MFKLYQITAPAPCCKSYYNYSKDPFKRWDNGYGFHNNKALDECIKYYGWKNFRTAILADYDTEDEAKHYMQVMIHDNHTDNPDLGFNTVANNSKPATEAQIVARGLRKPVLQLTVDDQVMAEYKSLNAAARATQGSATSISNCLHGRLKSYKGCHWQYASIE